MSDNPLQIIFQTAGKIGHCIQRQLSHFISDIHRPTGTVKHGEPLFSGFPIYKENLSNSDSAVLQSNLIINKAKNDKPVTKEELGRATWTFLHTLAAQYPENPTRQQKKDVKELMAIMSRIYPCKECADHFKEVLRANPVQVGSQAEFSQWLCHVHNIVNRSLGKPVFPCERVDARWGKLDCEQRACDLQGTVANYF